MLTKEQKIAKVEQAKAKIQDAKYLVFTTYTGIKTPMVEEMRNSLREVNSKYSVVKRTLGNIALRQAGYTDISLLDLFKGQLGFAYIKEDVFASLAALSKLQKDTKNQFQVVGGILEGNFYQVDFLQNLAIYPSKESFYTKFVFNVKYPIQKLVLTLNAIKDKKEN